MADVLVKIRELGRKKDRKSVYSVVSCSDLTPGSLDVWVDLPDEIKYDPSLAPFKQLYEQHHGKLDAAEIINEGDKNIFKKITELDPIGENQEDVPIKNNGHRLIEPMHAVEEKKIKSTKKKRIDRGLRVVKLCALVACWVLLTVSLLLNREKTDVVLHTAVKGGEIKEYEIHPTQDKVTVLVSLTGPFGEPSGNETANILYVWLHRVFVSGDGGDRLEQENYWKFVWEVIYQRKDNAH